MGGGCETSAHKTGAFHRICRSYELVVASGETLICSKEENADLYKAMAFSYGTLGFLTAVELDIVEATKFVKLEYHAAYTYDAALSLFMRHVDDGANNDFVEGLVFSKNRWVVMVGTMVNSAEPEKVNEMGRWYKPWFYKHAETFLETGFGREYIPLRDYYFRHTRSLFWLVAFALPYGNHPIFRHLFGWTLTIDFRLVKLVTGNILANQLVAQDFLIPPEGMADVITACDRQTGIWPLWVCPIKLDEVAFTYGMGKWATARQNKGETVMGIDFGCWGIPQIPNFNVEFATNKIMEPVLKHQGFQALYGDVFMTPEEIRQVVNLDHYEAMRKKYKAEDAFPHTLAKVGIKARVEGLK